MRTGSRRLAYYGLLAAAVTLVSEQHSCATPALALTTNAGGWSMAAQDCAKPTPAERRIWGGTSGARLTCRAAYRGSPGMSLTVYEMPGWPGATAFDAFQRWRRQPGKMAFYKGNYFGVVESATADPNAFDRFIVALEAQLPKGGGEAHW